MVTLALGGGKRGGKLLRQRLAFCLSWMYICDGFARDITKPNILKREEEISEKEEKIISPYDVDCNVIAEDFFVKKFPKACQYLQDCRGVLDKRDKGEGDYEAWYAFGRTQAIADSGKKLLFPYMSDLPHFVYTSQRDMLIYCGYAIYNESETELLFLKKILESSVLDYYMKNTSKPYQTGYYSYAKNYVKSFGIYPFTDEEKRHILSLKSKEEIDEYIRKIYQVAIQLDERINVVRLKDRTIREVFVR